MVLTLGVHGAAQATLVPTLGSITPSGGSFVWSYDFALAFDQNAVGGTIQTTNPVPTPPTTAAGDFLTIYDFRGLVSGSCFAPTGWACQTQAIGFTPSKTVPDDSASLTNLTFTRTGGTLTGPVADLGDFGASSSLGLMATGEFTSRGTRNQGPSIDTKIDDIGNVAVPATVPEPATLLLLGSTMVGLGVTLRRRRRTTGV
jgi:hypothetical protein